MERPSKGLRVDGAFSWSSARAAMSPEVDEAGSPGSVDLGVGDGDGLGGRQLDAVEGADDDLADLLVDLVVGESGKSIGIGGDLVHGRLQRLQVAGIALASKGDLGRGAVAVDIDRVDRVIEAAQVGTS